MNATSGASNMEGAALRALLLSLANQSSTLPSHATTMAWAGILDDGLLRPRTPYGLLWSLRGTMDMHTHIHTFNNSNSPHREVGFLAGEAPLSVHQSQEDMGEVRA